MQLSTLLLAVFQFLWPPALIGTTYLYFYPFIQQCEFPEVRAAEAACHIGQTKQAYVAAEKAPFRLLALADPQLEGDTSIPGLEHEDGVWKTLQRLLTGEEDRTRVFQRYRKELDLWGNDLYLAHVVRTMRWYTDPTHVVVLGDLLGSQWIGDEEFADRSERYWNRAFSGMEKVPKDITDVSSSKVEVLGKDRAWKRRAIAVAGNHDIGYAGDINHGRIARFEEAFGRVNWEIRFRLNESAQGSLGLWPSVPELRLLVLNTMNLDDPALDADLRDQTLDFLNQKLYQEPPPSDAGTVLLTHIPLHKPAGLCVDGPYFSHFPQSEGGGIREQNHVSPGMSRHILDGLVGPDRERRAIILNGHDHHGCQTLHTPSTNSSSSTADTSWTARSWPTTSPSDPASVREITVRSMMGEFGGNAGLLSAWWDDTRKEWRFEYASCVAGVQHIWWAVHVVDIVAVALAISWFGAALLENWFDARPRLMKRADSEKKRA